MNDFLVIKDTQTEYATKIELKGCLKYCILRVLVSVKLKYGT